MSRAPGKYVAGTMAPAGAALDRPALVVLEIHFAEIVGNFVLPYDLLK
jgi:hypothetical protein